MDFDVQSQLHQLARDFASWRKAKAHAREPVPRPLRQRAVSLTAHLSSYKVSQKLGLSPSLLHYWRKPSHQKNISPSSHLSHSRLDLTVPVSSSRLPVASLACSGISIQVFDRPTLIELCLALLQGDNL